MAGRLITVEGIDGCGKTTQVSLLNKWLIDKGIESVVLREPGGIPISEKIRAVLLDVDSRDMDPVAELLLYEASRAQLMAQIIRPALESSRTVLCDRFTDSTLAYQGYGRGLPLEIVSALNQVATGGIIPNLTIVIDVTLEQAQKQQEKKRLDDGSTADRLEREPQEFYKRVQSGFRDIAQRAPERVVLIDGSADVVTVAEAIRNSVESRFQSI